LVKDLSVKQTPHGVAVRAAYDTEHAQVMHISLEPGDELKWHVTPADVAFFILENRALASIGDDEEDACAGMLIENPKGIKRRPSNPHMDRASFLVMEASRPADSAKLH
jgi:quercetin dioxygenase-like cupin family protein